MDSHFSYIISLIIDSTTHHFSLLSYILNFKKGWNMNIDIVKSDNVDEKINRGSLIAIWMFLFIIGAYGVYDGEFNILAVASVLVFWGLCTILILRKMKSAK